MRLTELPYWLGIYIPKAHARIAKDLMKELRMCSVSEVQGVWEGESEQCLYIIKHFTEAEAKATQAAFSLAAERLLFAGEEAVLVRGDAKTVLIRRK